MEEMDIHGPLPKKMSKRKRRKTGRKRKRRDPDEEEEEEEEEEEQLSGRTNLGFFVEACWRELDFERAGLKAASVWRDGSFRSRQTVSHAHEERRPTQAHATFEVRRRRR